MSYLFGTNKRIGIVQREKYFKCSASVLGVCFAAGLTACAPIKWAGEYSDNQPAGRTLFVIDEERPDSSITSKAQESDIRATTSGASEHDSLTSNTQSSTKAQYLVNSIQDTPSLIEEEGELKQGLVGELDDLEPGSENLVDSSAELVEIQGSSIDMTEDAAKNVEGSVPGFSAALGIAVDKAAMLAEGVYDGLVSFVSSDEEAETISIEGSVHVASIDEFQKEKSDIVENHEIEEELTNKTSEIEVENVSSETLIVQHVQTSEITDSARESFVTSSHSFSQFESSAEVSEDESLIAEINKLTEDFPSAAGSLGSQESILLEKPNQSSVEPSSKKVDTVAAVQNKMVLTKVKPFSLSKENDLSWHLYQEGALKQSCSLVSPTIQLESKNYTTQVWFEVVNESLLVNTTTNLNSLQSGIGLRFDNGPLMDFSEMPFANKAQWSGDLEGLIMENSALRVYLGANDLGTPIPEIQISLSDLKRSYQEYSRCNSYQVSKINM